MPTPWSPGHLFIRQMNLLILLFSMISNLFCHTLLVYRAILKSNCYHKEGYDAPCEYGDTLFMLLFGAVQVVFSQIPDFHNMELLSIVAAVMSFAYTFIGLGLGFANVIGKISVLFLISH